MVVRRRAARGATRKPRKYAVGYKSRGTYSVIGDTKKHIKDTVKKADRIGGIKVNPPTKIVKRYHTI